MFNYYEINHYLLVVIIESVLYLYISNHVYEIRNTLSAFVFTKYYLHINMLIPFKSKTTVGNYYNNTITLTKRHRKLHRFMNLCLCTMYIKINDTYIKSFYLLFHICFSTWLNYSYIHCIISISHTHEQTYISISPMNLKHHNK